MRKDHEITYAVFTKPWPQLEAKELAAWVRSVGFEAIELPVRPGFQVEPEAVATELPRFAKRMAEEGVSIASIAGPTTEATFDACAQAQIPVIRVMFPLGDEGYLATESKVRRHLDALVPLCEKYGVQIGIQNHSGFFVPPNALGLRRLVEGYNPDHIGAILDFAHIALDGEEPEIAIDIVWSHLCMVNLKNAFWRRRNGPEANDVQWRPYWTNGRQGLASWPKATDCLRRRGYRGVVCLTAEYDAHDLIELLIQQDLAYARELLDRDPEGSFGQE